MKSSKLIRHRYQTLCIPSQFVLNKKPTQMLLNMPSAPKTPSVV